MKDVRGMRCQLDAVCRTLADPRSNADTRRLTAQRKHLLKSLARATKSDRHAA